VLWTILQAQARSNERLTIQQHLTLLAVAINSLVQLLYILGLLLQPVSRSNQFNLYTISAQFLLNFCSISAQFLLNFYSIPILLINAITVDKIISQAISSYQLH
jgi:hypothetical protein